MGFRITSLSPPDVEGDKEEDEDDAADYTADNGWVGGSSVIATAIVMDASWEEHVEMSAFAKPGKA